MQRNSLVMGLGGLSNNSCVKMLECVNISNVKNQTFEFFYNLSFPAKLWQNPASIDREEPLGI